MENIQQSHKNLKEKNTSIIQMETIKPQKKKQKERNKEIQSQLEKLRFKMVMNTYLLMITLNVNKKIFQENENDKEMGVAIVI